MPPATSRSGTINVRSRNVEDGIDDILSRSQAIELSVAISPCSLGNGDIVAVHRIVLQRAARFVNFQDVQYASRVNDIVHGFTGNPLTVNNTFAHMRHASKQIPAASLPAYFNTTP